MAAAGRVLGSELKIISRHDRMAATWRQKLSSCLRRIDDSIIAEEAYVDDGIALLDLAWKAHSTFNLQSPSDENSP